MDGSPNPSFILKADLGVLSENMVPFFLIKLWKTLKYTFKGMLEFDSIEKIDFCTFRISQKSKIFV